MSERPGLVRDAIDQVIASLDGQRRIYPAALLLAGGKVIRIPSEGCDSKESWSRRVFREMSRRSATEIVLIHEAILVLKPFSFSFAVQMEPIHPGGQILVQWESRDGVRLWCANAMYPPDGGWVVDGFRELSLNANAGAGVMFGFYKMLRQMVMAN